MTNLYDMDLWLTVFHLFMLSILVYGIFHRLWEHSRTTVITIVGFQIFGIILELMPIGVVVMYLIAFMCSLYYRAIVKPKKMWSKYETKTV